MLRDILSHRAIQAGLIFVLLVVCGSLMYSWQVERNLQAEAARDAAFRQRLQLDKAETETQPTAGGAPTDTEDTRNRYEGTGTEPFEDSDSPFQTSSDEKGIDPFEGSDPIDVNSDFPATEVAGDIPWEETAAAERLTKSLFEEWEAFGYELQKRYPVLFDQRLLEKLVQTREGRRQIKSQAAAIVDEALDEFERLFSQIPSDFSHAVLDSLEDHFRANPQGLPETYIDQALARMRSRIH